MAEMNNNKGVFSKCWVTAVHNEQNFGQYLWHSDTCIGFVVFLVHVHQFESGSNRIQFGKYYRRCDDRVESIGEQQFLLRIHIFERFVIVILKSDQIALN